MKFLKSLTGEDGELAGAYKNVTKALEKLSACSTQMALRNTEDIKLFLAENHEQVSAIEQQVNAQLGLLQDIKGSQDEHFARTEIWNEQFQKTQTQGFQQMAELFTERFGEFAAQHNKHGQNKVVDPAARTLAAVNHVRQWCFDQVVGTDTFLQASSIGLTLKYEKNAINTGYTWFFGDERYTSWFDGQTPLLLAHGGPGIGKSTLAHVATKVVKEKNAANIDRAVTASFHFNESRTEFRSLRNALLSLIFQITQSHATYNEQVDAVLTDDHPLCDGTPKVEVIWEELFCKKFNKQSN